MVARDSPRSRAVRSCWSECTKKPLGERTIVIGVFAAALLLTAVVASLPMETLVGVVPDDAFYYLVVGRNIAATGVSTFDGENLASGYHPGWMLLVTMAARWFHGNDATAARRGCDGARCSTPWRAGCSISV